MALEKKRTMTRISSVSYDVGKTKNLHFHVTAGSTAAALTAGYFNDMREDLRVNDAILIISVADGTGAFTLARATAVPASGNVTVVAMALTAP